MQNLIKTIVAASLISVFMACSNIEEPSMQPGELSSTLTRSSFPENEDGNSTMEQRQAIARWIAENYTPQEGKRVYFAVTRAQALGLDEVYYLKEFASQKPSANKITSEEPSEMSKAFTKYFSNINTVNSSQNRTSAKSVQYSISDNDYLQIYWPYSENWDHQTAPVVVFAPDNIDSFTAIGYKKNGPGKMVSVKVNEEYCENHPVWIVNESETSYSELPNFNSGEYMTPDGMLYSIPSARKIELDELNYVTTMYLGTVRSTKQHDSWIAGGSEYIFRFGSFTNTNLTCEADTSKCKPLLSRIKVTFSRNEIKKGKTKELNAVAVSNWTNKLLGTAMTLVEEDSGKENKSVDAQIGLKWKDLTFNLSISLPFRNHDDFIAERIYSRKYIMSSNNKDENGNWAVDCSDEVYWTLPYKIGFVLSSDNL